jgi:hypothetical protein
LKTIRTEKDKHSLEVFAPLESPAIYGGDDIDKILIPYRKGEVKTLSFLTWFTFTEYNTA